jgi:hypothetical protein
MRSDADEMPGGVARQPRIGIECQTEPDGRQQRQVADLFDEAGILAAAQ